MSVKLGLNSLAFFFQLAALLDFVHKLSVGFLELFRPFLNTLFKLFLGLANLVALKLQEIFHEEITTVVKFYQVTSQHSDEVGTDEKEVVVDQDW